jgi:hypothetical protein
MNMKQFLLIGIFSFVALALTNASSLAMSGHQPSKPFPQLCDDDDPGEEDHFE